VAHVAGGFEELRPQSDDVQTAWKVSYYLNDRTILHRLRHALTTHELKARLIWSSGKHLDLLPRSAGKRRAIEFIRKRWEVDRDQVLVSGDSGNDIDMLADPGYRGVAVGNAEEELEVLEDEDTFHQASLPHAAGVLEGTEEFDFWDADAGARGKKEEGD